METIGLEMDDIFGAEEEHNRVDAGAEQNAEQTPFGNEDENTFDLNLSAKIAKGAAKKVVRNPQPKLDPQRLSGPRGIAILPKLFDNVKFKGKGYEAQDLEKVIKGLEHWAHRLFPKRTFDECLQRIERLGKKGDVKTVIKKIRFDIPLLDEDFLSKPEEEEGTGNAEGEDAEMNEAESAFDEMMQTSTSSQQMMSPPPLNSQMPFGLASPIPTPNSSCSKPKIVLSDEVKEKIARNRRLAMERRSQKLQDQTLQSQDISLSNASPKQCQASPPPSAEERTGANTEVVMSGNKESVHSVDDAKQVTSSMGINTPEALGDPASSISAREDKEDTVSDKVYSVDKQPESPVSDQTMPMCTLESLGNTASPIPASRDTASSVSDKPYSDDKKLETPVGDQSSDLGTIEESLGVATSPISSGGDTVSMASDKLYSDDKKPETPVSDQPMSLGTLESLGDLASPFSASGDTEDTVVCDNPYSDDKKPESPVGDQPMSLGTLESLGDLASPFSASGDTEDTVVCDNPYSDDKKPESPVGDQPMSLGTLESLGDLASPFSASGDTVVCDNPYSDENKPESPVSDLPMSLGTSDLASPF